MSKQVRISEDLAARVGTRAQADKRSFANMVEVLLLEALGGSALTERPAVRASSVGRSASADVAATIPGVTIASTVCGVCPPGRSRPACSLVRTHDGKHSWEA